MITVPDLGDPAPAGLLERMARGHVGLAVDDDVIGLPYLVHLDDLGWHAHRRYSGAFDPKMPITCPACNADFHRKFPDAAPTTSVEITVPRDANNKEKDR